MDEVYFKKIMSTAIIVLLIVLFFLLLRPILLSVVMGLILAFVFISPYKWVQKKVHSKNFAAAIICILFAVLLILPVWYFTPIAVEQSLKLYMMAQQLDLVTLLKQLLPSIFNSEQFSSEMGSVLKSFITKTANSLMSSVSGLILNFPTLFLHLMVVCFTFFFALRDNEELISYIKSLLPFEPEVERRLFNSSRGIMISVLYGQIIIGLLQGIVVGVGFFALQVSNAFLLTSLACLAGVFPVIGTTIVWLPVVIYLIIGGNTFAAIGITIFGLISTFLDNFIRPVFVSRKTNLPSSLILIGMIGGLFLFGILGLIIGPLIVAYFLIVLEVYRPKKEQRFLVSFK